LSQVLVASSRAIISTAPCCAKKLLCKKYALLKKSKQPKMSSSRLVHQLQPPCWSTEQHRQSQTQHIDKKSWYTVARKIAVQQLRGKLRYRSWDENCDTAVSCTHTHTCHVRVFLHVWCKKSHQLIIKRLLGHSIVPQEGFAVFKIIHVTCDGPNLGA
jgi:hypothetical protein